MTSTRSTYNLQNPTHGRRYISDDSIVDIVDGVAHSNKVSITECYNSFPFETYLGVVYSAASLPNGCSQGATTITVFINNPPPSLSFATVNIKEGFNIFNCNIKTGTLISGKTYSCVLNQQVDISFSSSAWITISFDNLVQSGTPSSPVIGALYSAGLDSDAAVIISHMTMTMLSSKDPSEADWGGLPRLTNGVVMRTVGRHRQSYYIGRSNRELRYFGATVEYPAKISPGQYITTARVNLQQVFGKAICLMPEYNDKLEILIQDNLTGGYLVAYYTTVCGHIFRRT